LIDRDCSDHPVQVPDKFHKGSQEKNTPPVAGVFLAAQPAPWSRIVMAFNLHVGWCQFRASMPGTLLPGAGSQGSLNWD